MLLYCPALAFCDWDQVQSHRREILQQFTLPHSHSSNWKQLDLMCQEECSELVSHVSNLIAGEESAVVDIRPLIMKVGKRLFTLRDSTM